MNPKIPFVEGTISYAGSGDNSRTSQLFISYGAHKSLGTQKWVSSGCFVDVRYMHTWIKQAPSCHTMSFYHEMCSHFTVRPPFFNPAICDDVYLSSVYI